MIPDEAEEAAAYVANELMIGRKHDRSMSEDSTRNGKLKKKASRRTVKPKDEKIKPDFAEDVPDETDADGGDYEKKMSSEEAIKRMKKLLTKNKSLRYDFDKLSEIFNAAGENADKWDQNEFYEAVKTKFEAAIDKRTQKGHFDMMNDIKPKTSYAKGERSFKDYVKKG
ncbi:hypothetical protein F443_02104 [Phytophthora nicotianae P1569]|uniref:Uncharacterized protein n=1 Tax=Phytophthora nicotianae P1569 TaxID=1317065 RepID=V9FVV7_PHYNI|nr:hypothetical protein F443_02104 [Phytophthora nicotianae P1569]